MSQPYQNQPTTHLKKENLIVGAIIPISFYLNDFELYSSESKKAFGCLRDEISHWREFPSDGDSFYRVFMFGLLENYILSQNTHEIKKIILEDKINIIVVFIS